MHDHGIADEILEALLKEARKRSACRITSARIQVGEFSGVTEAGLVDGLLHCCEHAGVPPFDIEVTICGPMCLCRDCGAEFEVDGAGACPACGSKTFDIKPASGVTIASAEFA